VLVHEPVTTGVVSVAPPVLVGFIVKLLAECALSGVPVIGAGGMLVGMVTEFDLLRGFA